MNALRVGQWVKVDAPVTAAHGIAVWGIELGAVCRVTGLDDTRIYLDVPNRAVCSGWRDRKRGVCAVSLPWRDEPKLVAA